MSIMRPVRMIYFSDYALCRDKLGVTEPERGIERQVKNVHACADLAELPAASAMEGRVGK